MRVSVAIVRTKEYPGEFEVRVYEDPEEASAWAESQIDIVTGIHTRPVNLGGWFTWNSNYPQSEKSKPKSIQLIHNIEVKDSE